MTAGGGPVLDRARALGLDRLVAAEPGLLIAAAGRARAAASAIRLDEARPGEPWPPMRVAPPAGPRR